MKQTIVNQNGKSYIQEITVKDIEKTLDYISRQTRQHLDFEDNIQLEVKKQLNQLLDAIDTNSISSQNIDAYLELWQPLYIPSDNRPAVVLTLYNDGEYQVKSYLPASFFEIIET